MATQEIVQSFSYVSWALLVGLGLGSFALAWLLRQVTDVTSGYVGTTALCAGILAALGWGTDTGLPAPDQLKGIVAAPAARRSAADRAGTVRDPVLLGRAQDASRRHAPAGPVRWR